MEKLNRLNFADIAEKVMLSMQTEDRRGNKVIKFTTSKIRNMLTMVNGLYNDLLKNRDEILSDDLKGTIQYIKMRFAYEAGREKNVKEFIEKANLMKYLDDIGDSREKAMIFCNYMEALVAYHKYHDGKNR